MRRQGFTLIEMMIVVAMMGVLASLAIPRMATLIRNANEAATKKKLQALRSAITLYYSDLEGLYPSDLTPLLQPGSKYLTNVLPVYTVAHGNSNQVTLVADAPDGADVGGWGFVSSGAQSGQVWVQCTHTDTKGNLWNSY